MNRRLFLAKGSLALLVGASAPAVLTRLLAAEEERPARKKVLVFIFLRGAVDGLNMVIPFGERSYYAARRSIAIAPPLRGRPDAAIELDGFFGMHPALGPLAGLYRRHELAVVHAVGLPQPNRSHFKAQHLIETGLPTRPDDGQGWLNRVLAATDPHSRAAAPGGAAHAAEHAQGEHRLALDGGAALWGVAFGTSLPVSLRGRHPSLAVADLERDGFWQDPDRATYEALARMYASDADDVIAASSLEGMEAMKILRGIQPERYRPAADLAYPEGEFGRSLQQIAQMVKADVGLEIAVTDFGGWDTHRLQGGAEGAMARRLRLLAAGLETFHRDMGDRMEDVAVVVMSEFGRTVAENGSGGTDHGHGNCALVLGGSTAGGRVYGSWPGLELEQLEQARDLRATTDFRLLLGEVASRHLGARRLPEIFPGFDLREDAFLRVLG